MLNCTPTSPSQSQRKKRTLFFYFFLKIIFSHPQVIALGFWIGRDTYMRSAWNVMDGFLVVVSWIDVIVSQTTETESSILGVLRVFRALRTLRPLR